MVVVEVALDPVAHLDVAHPGHGEIRSLTLAVLTARAGPEGCIQGGL
ncbi:hypothetical protein AM2010_2118 [Pelagerythrobacter marensis]|uniref:Uncharacterized protein n=1 Tax=Pelagerythrobacter marensis TaxID=543877 RepID=A0A0G3XCT7_9SPHN|nr:hypothetical protein AM2010_2118 [Pelagerythrobacter marensis]